MSMGPRVPPSWVLSGFILTNHRSMTILLQVISEVISTAHVLLVEEEE